MKISVIIPAYNEEKHIGKSLKAILAQKYEDFEVIVVDNGSSDKTVEVARAFPVKVVYEHRKGTMWACERGRQGSSGEIIVRMDADCLPEKDWLKKGAAYFNDENVVAASGPYDYHDGKPSLRLASHIMQLYVYRPINVLFQFIRIGATMIGGNSFIRATILQEVGGFDTQFIFYGDDTNLAQRLAKRGKVVFHKDLTLKTSARRFHNEGTTNLGTKYLYHFFKNVFFPKKKAAATKEAA